MKLKATIITVTAVTVLMFLSQFMIAQTAKVVQLSDIDAAEAKMLFDQRLEIDKKIADLEEKIRRNYLVDKTIPSTIWANGKWIPNYLEGWRGGFFQYSEDFRFIVPNPPILNYTAETGRQPFTACPTYLLQDNPAKASW